MVDEECIGCKNLIKYGTREPFCIASYYSHKEFKDCVCKKCLVKGICVEPCIDFIKQAIIPTRGLDYDKS
jgi:hypothetical protein